MIGREEETKLKYQVFRVFPPIDQSRPTNSDWTAIGQLWSAASPTVSMRQNSIGLLGDEVGDAGGVLHLRQVPHEDRMLAWIADLLTL